MAFAATSKQAHQVSQNDLRTLSQKCTDITENARTFQQDNILQNMHHLIHMAKNFALVEFGQLILRFKL